MKYQDYIDSVNNYIKKNETDKALEYSKLLISKFPEKESGYNFLWKIYLSLGKKNKSLNAFSNLIKLYKNDFGKLNAIGAKLIELKSFDEAIICFETVANSFKKVSNLETVLKNNLITSYSGLIKIYNDRNDFKSALKYNNRILEISNKDTNYLLLKATILVSLFQYNKAVSILNDLLKIDSDFFQAYHLLGKIYHRMSLWDDSRKSYEKALELSSNNEDIKSDLLNVTDRLSSEIEVLEKDKLKLILDDSNFIADQTFSQELSNVFSELGRNNLFAGNFKTGIDYLELGEGYIDLDFPKDNDLIDAKKIITQPSKTPNFFGSWEIDDLTLCDNLVEIFEENSSSHQEGTTVGGVDTSSKLSTDLSINPNLLKLEKFQRINDYFFYLRNFFQLYVDEWDIIKLKSNFKVGTFNIQKYNPGGHFKKPHFERMSAFSQHRYFAFMSYLNDVEEGGETVFPYYDLNIKPTKGHTLIWPADWTHMHYGDEVKRGVKYIITGWIESHN